MTGPLRPTATLPAPGSGARRVPFAPALALFFVWVLPWITGCASDLRAKIAVMGPGHQPTNFFQADPKLPASLKRVAILPMTAGAPGTDLSEARATLEKLLLSELGKSGRFEVLPLAPATLRQLTGKAAWSTGDLFPTNFFERLRDSTGCDAVLFSELTVYKAYPPLAVGWKLRLMDVDGPNVWWAVDEVFDASETTVANSAKRYHLAHAGKPYDLTDPAEILQSPRRFGGYAANAVVATCPKR